MKGDLSQGQLVHFLRGPAELPGENEGRFGQRGVDGGEYFQALSRAVTGALADTTAEGNVYRVDVRLRRPLTLVEKAGPVSELRLYADDPDGFVRQARDVKASAGAQEG